MGKHNNMLCSIYNLCKNEFVKHADDHTPISLFFLWPTLIKSYLINNQLNVFI